MLYYELIVMFSDAHPYCQFLRGQVLITGESVMSPRQEIETIIARELGNPETAKQLMGEIDPIIHALVGEDDTDDTEMPKLWSPGLKKQYKNFRNHLRRAMRAKWSTGND